MTSPTVHGRTPTDTVLVVTSTLPLKAGDGVPRFVLDLSIALADYFDVTLLAPHSAGAPTRDVMEGVSVRRFRYFWPARWQRLTQGGAVSVNVRRKGNALQIPLLLVAGTVATLREVRRSRCVVVNAHWLVPQGLAAAVACAMARVPLILHVHAGDVYLLARLPGGRLVARFVVWRSAKVFADGSHVRDALDSLLGTPSGAELRPMGVWVDRFRSGPTARSREAALVIFVGRLVEKKGVHFLLEAMVTVREAVPEARLVVIGSGPLESDLRQQVTRLGITDMVEFVGPLPHAELIPFLHRASVACVPSVIDSRGETEGMPTVVIEAMAAGLRVVGSEVNGIPDILRHSENGWLAKPADSRDLARQLLAALHDPRGPIVVDNAAATAAQHDWRNVARRYADVIREVIGV